MARSAPAVTMSKKVDCSFMKHISTDHEWAKEVKEGWEAEGVKIKLAALFDNEDPFADCA